MLLSFGTELANVSQALSMVGVEFTQERTLMCATNKDVSVDYISENSHFEQGLICKNEDPVAFRELLTKVGDKWSIFIMLALSMLSGERARFSEINRSIPTISERMLALTLRNLERDGLVTRELFPEVPPRVEYELTAMGKSLLPALQGLVDWVAENSENVKVARTAFDAR